MPGHDGRSWAILLRTKFKDADGRDKPGRITPKECLVLLATHNPACGAVVRMRHDDRAVGIDGHHAPAWRHVGHVKLPQLRLAARCGLLRAGQRLFSHHDVFAATPNPQTPAGLDRCEKRATADFALIVDLAVGDRAGDCSVDRESWWLRPTSHRAPSSAPSSRRLATAGVATSDVASVAAREVTLRAKCKRRIAMLLCFIPQAARSDPHGSSPVTLHHTSVSKGPNRREAPANRERA